MHHVSAGRQIIVFSHDTQVLTWARNTLQRPRDKIIELDAMSPAWPRLPHKRRIAIRHRARCRRRSPCLRPTLCRLTLVVLQSAWWSRFCHHQLRLAIDYTPEHQDDQGSFITTLPAYLGGHGNPARSAQVITWARPTRRPQ
jgi:hypothetical protein